MIPIKHVTFYYIKTVSMGYVSISVINPAFGDAAIHIPILLDACYLYYSNSSIITTAQTSADYLSKFYRIAKSRPNTTEKDKHQELAEIVVDETFL